MQGISANVQYMQEFHKLRYICESESEVTQSCPTLCDPMDCSLPGFSVHRIFQASVLEWVAISFSKDIYIYIYMYTHAQTHTHIYMYL